ncbi:hypothetical protein [Teredinibacter sp. KSP-S5-2]|uniref:hypothetical protein n=1 Tax=Teredinibacter sp. KSP-S5-2 TaxID=3034506 RepID=UPI0029342B6E|nr:hypothetical protein [Teredinibacter sp. KSP-S5-2]WNO11139.1 hypothetical protein P5V12_08135 [Teredinibacter sp. KSP-S5-2]
MKKQYFLFSVLYFISVFIHASEQNDLFRYLDIVKGNNWAAKTNLYKELADMSGVSDPQLFDLVELDLKKFGYGKISDDRRQIETIWGIKALASSGNIKYQNTLDMLAEKAKDTKVKRVAKASREDLVKFSKWNPVIVSDEFLTDDRTKEQALWMRFLHQDDPAMWAHAIRSAYNAFSYEDEVFSQLVRDRLQGMYKTKTYDHDALEFQAWACKYLGGDLDQNYKFLKVVARQAKSSKVRRWAIVATEGVYITKHRKLR